MADNPTKINFEYQDEKGAIKHRSVDYGGGKDKDKLYAGIAKIKKDMKDGTRNDSEEE